MAVADKVCLGVITGAHGVKGAVKVKSFTDNPADAAAYGPVTDETGERMFEIEITGSSGNALVAQLSGVDDRDAALALKGVGLYAPRAALPDTEEGEYYHADLVGLRVELLGGEKLGVVKALHNFGAGDIIEVDRADGSSVMLPFTRQAVPKIDMDAGLVIVDPPPGLLGEGDDQAMEEEGEIDER